MAENYYDDGPEAAAKAPDKQPPSEHDEDKEHTDTALVPKSLCPGMKPGDEFMIRIERELEDQYEISYPKQEAKEGEEEKPEPEAPAPPPGQMAGYME